MAFANPKRNIEQFQLESGMEVADFGAGSGYLAVEAAEAVGNKGIVYVIDIQKGLLTKAAHLAKKRHLDRMVFVRADLEKPEGSTLPSQSIDAVIVSNILFQVEKKEAVLTEAHRVLRSNGRMLLVDWHDSFGGLGPQPEHVITETAARSLAESVGFQHSADIDAGTYHYGMIFTKDAQ